MRRRRCWPRKRGDTEVARLLGGASPVERARPMLAVAHGQMPPTLAAEKAFRLLERQSHNFIRIGGCNSCHSQDLPSAASGFARSQGVAAAAIPQLPPSMLPPPERIMDLGAISVNSIAWELLDFGMNQVPSDFYTDAVVRYIKAMQTPEGNWSSNEGRRPPMNSGDFQTAALAIYAMKRYGAAADVLAVDAAIGRATRWLEHSAPVTTQDRAFHLLGLAWGGGSPAVLKRTKRELVSMQRADGGWSQLPQMSSDAYATGQVLFALHQSRMMQAKHRVYRKGTMYLLTTQAEDGSWHVSTRAIWLQPYFESGFPYGRDQFISAAGTAWAVMALSPAIEPLNPAGSATTRASK